MMMSQRHFGRGAYDPFYRSNPRSLARQPYQDLSLAYQPYQDRSLAYQPYHSRHELRSDRAGRPGAQATIHEPEQDTVNGQGRKRIPVACSRCRRRKIKCSGDPGDSTGCSSCQSSGADISLCTFDRVGTLTELYTRSSEAMTPYTPVYDQGHSTFDFSSTGLYDGLSRPSVPTLQTRIAPGSYGMQYDDSHIDQFGYSTNTGFGQRQDSLTSAYGYTAGPQSTPVTASYPEPMGSNVSFNSSLASYPQMTPGRFAPTTTDGFSTLNLTSLHLSLPAPHERRLPVPPMQQYQPSSYSNVEVPDIRPITAPSLPNAHIHGTYSRTAMPWPFESTSAGSRQNSTNGLAPLSQSSVSSSGSEPAILGYHVARNSLQHSLDSPSVSPTTTGNTSTSYQTITMPASSSSIYPPTFRYPTTSTPYLPALIADERPSSRLEQPASLYSFSADTAETPGSMAQSLSNEGAIAGSHSYMPIRHSQPQHAASVEALRRETSSGQQQRSASHRASASSLDTLY